MAATQVGRRKRRHEQLLRLPVVRAARPDLAATDRRQLPGLSLHHLVLRDVLDRLSIAIVDLLQLSKSWRGRDR